MSMTTLKRKGCVKNQHILILILFVVHLDLVIARRVDIKPSVERYKPCGQYIISHHVAFNGVLLSCGQLNPLFHSLIEL